MPFVFQKGIVVPIVHAWLSIFGVSYNQYCPLFPISFFSFLKIQLAKGRRRDIYNKTHESL